jgi:hypothetical protein
MKSNVITKQEHKLNIFKAKYESISGRNGESGTNVEIGYLKGCETVRVFIDQNAGPQKDPWVAGYAVNTKKPFRYLSVYDSTTISHILTNSNVPTQDDICELTVIWYGNPNNDKYVLSERNKSWIYIWSLWDAFRTNRYIVIGGSVEPKIWHRFKRVLTNILFLGPVTLKKADEKSHEKLALVVWQYNDTRILIHLCKALLEMVLLSIPFFTKKDSLSRFPSFRDIVTLGMS